MKPSFLKRQKPFITGMILCNKADDAQNLIKNSIQDGADAIGIQLERLQNEEKTEENIKRIFSAAVGNPIYITNYRVYSNENKTDEEIAEELITYLGYGATLGDVPASLFDPEAEMFKDKELSMKTDAVSRQMELVKKIHSMGKEVLMSSHVPKFLTADEVLEIAFEHQRRGADVSKIVTMANSIDEEMENLKITTILKRELKIPFLFLAQGSYAKIHRMIGTQLGCLMCLAVREHNETSVPTQPTIKAAKAVRDNMREEKNNELYR